MNAIKLSKRLICAANMVRKGAKVADVGCDHGKLSAYLITQNIAKSVVATDINPMPLAKAKALFEQMKITENAKTRLCNGLQSVDESEADDIVIAGIGAATIFSILTDITWLKNTSKQLILVPASHHERLRKKLYAVGFEIISETAVYEAAHCYSVMSVAYSGEETDISPAFAALGKIKNNSDDAFKYIELEKNKAMRLLDTRVEQEKSDDAKHILQYINEVLR